MPKYPVSLECVLIQDVIEIKKSHPGFIAADVFMFASLFKSSKQLITS